MQKGSFLCGLFSIFSDGAGSCGSPGYRRSASEPQAEPPAAQPAEELPVQTCSQLSASERSGLASARRGFCRTSQSEYKDSKLSAALRKIQYFVLSSAFVEYSIFRTAAARPEHPDWILPMGILTLISV